MRRFPLRRWVCIMDVTGVDPKGSAILCLVPERSWTYGVNTNTTQADGVMSCTFSDVHRTSIFEAGDGEVDSS